MATASETRVYTVEGMRCEHCLASVREEIGELEGVDEVHVELERGRLEVRGTGFDDNAVGTVVEEAGYELVARL